jgi:predicted alpha/beta-hydrolase family hydrolase
MTATTSSARLIWRARSIAVFMLRTVYPQAINLLMEMAVHSVKMLWNSSPPNVPVHTSGVAFSIPNPVTIAVNEQVRVSGLMQQPDDAKACLVLAHGAGAGMDHPFMATLARDLEALGIATLRYQFPYTEKRGKRPDPPALCHATVRAAAATAHELAPSLPLLAGGKSFGGRMTSQAQADEPLSHVCGLVFFGFPLHPPKQLSIERAAHLFHVEIPMLFLQGTRDALAELALLEPLVARLGKRATLASLENADHSFHVPSRSGRTDAQVRSEMLAAFEAWTETVISSL